ncbi:hypothetical protein ASF22_00015 [Methylobacterium sp. Leaf87]|uniref:L,D-transpeptidase n=1 Tax=Methylobacterium sp. Leaf87 TaxID=1736243 RepID=UPI0007018231|nr:L,D-transpeptidase [Methylobacterium sp. Leaf87]KQO72778.1 hypothetical protein ASF22_00015 [Methylobacterium sp. Leaf87]
MRIEGCVAGVALAMGITVGITVGASPAAAQAAPGRYGGGLIEFLMSDAPPPAPAGGRYEAAPMRRLSSGDRVPEAMPPAVPVPPRVRLAALPPVEARPEESGRTPQMYGRPPEAYGRAPEAYGRAPQAYGREPGPAYGQQGAETIGRAADPRFARQVVAYDGGQRPGTIVVDTPGKFLYLVQPGGKAIRYGIGVGRPGFAWSGLKSISQKREWPDWTPPSEMIRRRPDLPRHMAGGPGNPLGARALYLGSSLYRIHGTNEPHTIGQSVSSGCIRMMNEDVIDLYERTPVGTRVEVL